MLERAKRRVFFIDKRICLTTEADFFWFFFKRVLFVFGLIRILYW